VILEIKKNSDSENLRAHETAGAAF
jgi:hypothetical protein